MEAPLADLSAFRITRKWPAQDPGRIQLYSLPTPNGVGPMFGQVGFFHRFAGKDYEDKRPRDRYVAESRRLLEVLDARLADRPWIVGEAYTIADMAIFPWVRNLVGFYGAGDLVRIADFPHVTRALNSFLSRPAVVQGVGIPSRARTS